MAEFASKGVAGTALGLGIAGTALSLMNNGGCGNGILGGLFGNNSCSENCMVNRYELNLVRENDTLKTQVALRDANTFTDGKILELYKYVDGELRDIRQKANDTAAAQAVINAKVESGIGILNSQVSSMSTLISGLTKTIIPNSSVCPGWGNVCVQATGCSCPSSSGNI